MQNVSSQLKQKQSAQTDTAGAMWLVQVITGALLILLLGLHMIAHHYVVEGGLRTFRDVQDYISNPLIFTLEVLFLIVVTPHAMLGVLKIILDLGPSKSAERAILWVIRVITVAIIAYGIWLAVAIQGL